MYDFKAIVDNLCDNLDSMTREQKLDAAHLCAAIGKNGVFSGNPEYSIKAAQIIWAVMEEEAEKI